MNKKIIRSSLVCLLTLLYTQAEASSVEKDQANTPSPKPGYNLSALYGYQSFKFDSIKPTSFNRFSGHLNLYMAGGNNFRLREGLTAGLYIYEVKSNVHSSMRIDPGLPSETDQKVKNDSIYGHLLQTITPNLLVDVMAGLGYNSLSYSTTIGAQTENQQLGRAHSNSNNWFTSINGIYSRSFSNWKFLGSIGLLYSQIEQDSFNYSFIPNQLVTRVPFLRNKSAFSLENAEIGYQLKEWVQPFVNVGLIQVLQFSNNRPGISGEFVGALPEFNLDQNGYRAGGGLSFKYKKLSLRIEHQYSQRGSVYHSNLTMLSLHMNMA